MKKSGVIVLVIISLVIIILIIRLINPRELDDVSPEIPCPELEKYNPDILYVIPFYNNKPISENKTWCSYILSLNKTFAMHGVYHEYREFLYQNISQEELEKGINEFEECFVYKPIMFKPPQLKISEENKKLIKENNLKLRTEFNQITHKTYHCNNSGRINNKIIELF